MNASVRTFGKYLLDQEIARGGMSRVYLARLRGLGGFEKRLVVKQILPELASDPRFVSMFVHEAKTLVQMSHPHIAPVYELGVVDGVYFLAMEYVEGATLAQILRDGPLPAGLVAHLGAEIGDALHYAHTRFEIVHRDVTPRNVIVDAGGHSRLLDFGIAAPAEDEDAALFGTPGYLSPEVLAAGPIGPPSDVFSLGAVLFEALTGRRAFPGNTVQASRDALARGGPRFEPEDGVAPELARVVERALARDPRIRFGSARELGRALRGWLASHAPEGVAPELGQRAEAADAGRASRPWDDLVPDEEGVEEPRQPSEIETLATSRLLDRLLQSEPKPPSAPSAAPAGTVPIEGRRSQPGPGVDDPSGGDPRSSDEEVGAGTIPLESRESTPTTADALPDVGDASANVADEADEADEADAGQVHATVAPASRARLLSVWTVAAVLVLGALAVWVAGATFDPPGESDATSIAASPTGDGRAAEAEGTAERRGTDGPGGDTGAEIETGAETGAETESESETETETETETESESESESETETETGTEAGTETGTGTEAATDTGTATAPAARATLTVNATPWAEVLLDGRSIGTTPQRRVPVRPGRHTLELSCPPLGRSARATFEVTAGDGVTAIADLSADPPTMTVR